MKKSSVLAPLAVAAIALFGSASANAQQAGTWLFRAGVMSIMPDVKSGELSAPSPPNTRIDVDSATTLAGGISYMLTDNWSLDLPLAWPLKHHISGAGEIGGSGEIATVRVVPATLFGQYRFYEASSQWRPYLGLGLTYASFSDETGNGTLTAITNPGSTGTTLKIKDKFALTPQVGVTYAITPAIYVEGMIAKTFLKVRTTLSTGQTIDAKLDPITAGLYIGYRY